MPNTMNVLLLGKEAGENALAEKYGQSPLVG
jgi:phosphoribosylamine-glycine ligase